MSVFTDSRNMMIFQCEEFLIKYDVSYGRKIKAHNSFYKKRNTFNDIKINKENKM